MTASVRSASPDDDADGRGDVPHDESAALESVENGEAVAIPSVAGVLRGLVPAPADLGSTAHPPLEPAPGSYVLDRDPPRPAGERPAAAHAGGSG